jgi:hypothetical protein
LCRNVLKRFHLKTLTEISYGVNNLQILKVSGPNDADRQPLRCRQVADGEKQVSCLLEKIKKYPKFYRDVNFYGSSA